MSDVPLLNTTVMSHNDGQRIALLTKLFCMSKVANFFGQILNIWIKLILKKKFQIFVSMFSFA